MIGKVAAAGAGFRGVINYLLMGRGDQPDPERVSWTETRNLLLDDPSLAPRLMRATAAQAVRCAKPVYHFVISWHRDEAPGAGTMRSVADTTLADLELADHQAVLVAHADTRHCHLHVVVNRVHPDTGKAWHAGRDYARIEISLRRQAEAMGMPYVPGRHNDPERFGGRPRRVRDGEYQQAVRGGAPPPRPRWDEDQIRRRREDLAPLFRNARSWDELHAHLAVHGLTLARKGQGIVIGDGSGYMKLSDLGKDIRLKALEQRLGLGFDGAAVRTAEAARAWTGDGRAGRDESGRETVVEEVAADRDALRRDRVRRGPPPAAEGEGQSDALPSPPSREPARPREVSREEPPPSPRTEAFAALRQVRQEHDLARRLNAMGLVSDAAIRRSRQAVTSAQTALKSQLSDKERLEQELYQALRRQQPVERRPQARAKSSSETVPPKATPPKRRGRNRDRGR